MPDGKVIHLILDNYGAHKHAKVGAWLDRHPRFVFHYTPTSASWLNAVEGFFAKLSKRRLKRGVFRSLVDLQAAINRFVAETNEALTGFRGDGSVSSSYHLEVPKEIDHRKAAPPRNPVRATNENPKPFIWTADPDHTIAAVRRGYQALDSIH